MPHALAIMSEVASDIERFGIFSPQLDELKDFLLFIKIILGVDLTQVSDISSKQKELLAKRRQAREDKDWKVSDQVRETLSEQGILLRDMQGEQIWSRS
jgi:cysteinyl-tRNA synthetase